VTKQRPFFSRCTSDFYAVTNTSGKKTPQDSKDEDITAEAITVPEEFAKDNETRIIEPLSPNFIKWINHIKRREGSFQQVPNLKRKWIKAKKSIGRDWPHDCLRHSYASYHFAEYNDAGLTAKNLGHPDSTLLRKGLQRCGHKGPGKGLLGDPADPLPIKAKTLAHICALWACNAHNRR